MPVITKKLKFYHMIEIINLTFLGNYSSVNNNQGLLSTFKSHQSIQKKSGKRE